MIKRFEQFSASDRFEGDSAEELTKWQREKRILLKHLMGLDKLESSGPFKQTLTEQGSEVIEDGITRTKYIFRVDEYTYMPLYILRPKGESKGTFLALAGHGGAGKYSVAGVKEIPVVAQRIDFYNYDYGVKLARLGWTVICPDPRGFGERRDSYAQGDDDASFTSCSCRNLSHMAVPLGITVIGLCTYDHIRLIDYLEESEEFDISDLGCLGFSGGGMQTLYLSAVDERIKHAYISGYMYGFKDSLLILNNNCSCNYIPGLWEHFDMGDIGAMIAPRPLFIQSCADDHLNGPRGLANVYEQMDILKKAYGIFGEPEVLIHDIRPGEHHFHDEPIADTVRSFTDHIRKKENI
ncbi:MAG: alpha/beta hydrolase family protein [Lachnospiraceae bacterium]|nr:alpha/beta hydrolase family protein [Lachnospiraceae bacterium]